MVTVSIQHAHFAPEQVDILALAVDQYRDTSRLTDFLVRLEALGFSDQAKREYVLLVESTRKL